MYDTLVFKKHTIQMTREIVFQFEGHVLVMTKKLFFRGFCAECSHQASFDDPSNY